jgi:glucose/arabinose dehydrogenase
MRFQLTRWGISFFAGLAMCSFCQADPPTEDDFYPIVRFEVPEEAVLEPGGFQMMPDGRLALGTRRGEIWMVRDPFASEVKPAQYSRFAHGLHEVLSLAERDGWLYAVERGDVIRMKDTDANGTADLFEIVCDDWEICGDQHEYAFGSKFDSHGDLWVTLCLTGSAMSKVPYRGWCVRVTPQGKMIPTTSGIRSPGGVGINAAGDVFYTDNQGPWNGTCTLRPLRPGKFVGHPAGNKWYELPEAAAAMGPAPREPESGSRLIIEGEKIPELDQPAILFPYKKMGQSASGVTCDLSGGRFGPFTGQMFVGDQTYSTVMRCDLEQVNGVYQGACFPFREGFGSGIVGLEMTPRGAMFAGGTARGWGARGTKEFSVERVDWTGKTPFEIQTMRLEPDGFTLTFTQPADSKSATDPASYSMQTYCYIYQSSYGSPEVDQTVPNIESITMGVDGKSVRMKVAGLVRGHVHELHAAGVRSQEGLPLLHQEAYYTLNELKK